MFFESFGDVRCILYGHLTRLAVLMLLPAWEASAPMCGKLTLFGKVIDGLGDFDALITRLSGQTGKPGAKLPKPRSKIEKATHVTPV